MADDEFVDVVHAGWPVPSFDQGSVANNVSRIRFCLQVVTDSDPARADDLYKEA